MHVTRTGDDAPSDVYGGTGGRFARVTARMVVVPRRARASTPIRGPVRAPVRQYTFTSSIQRSPATVSSSRKSNPATSSIGTRSAF